MNDLNSILLEGAVEGDVQAVNGRACFAIKSFRYYKWEDGAIHKTVIAVNIKTKGKLGEICAENLKKDQRVRIVGRLGTDLDGGIYIFAEHVEFRPGKAKKA